MLEAGMFDPVRGYPSVVPYLRYEDPAAAIRWLTEVLDAREMLRMTLPDGRIGHAELSLGDRDVVAVGLNTQHGGQAPPTDRATVRAMTLVFVADVDAATDRARLRGGTVVEPPVDQPWGVRQSIVSDPGGYLWEPSTYLRDVAPADWGAEVVTAPRTTHS